MTFSTFDEYEEAAEIGRLTAIHLRRLRAVQARHSLPVGDPERADDDDVKAIQDEDFWS